MDELLRLTSELEWYVYFGIMRLSFRISDVQTCLASANIVSAMQLVYSVTKVDANSDISIALHADDQHRRNKASICLDRIGYENESFPRRIFVPSLEFPYWWRENQRVVLESHVPRRSPNAHDLWIA